VNAITDVMLITFFLCDFMMIVLGKMGQKAVIVGHTVDISLTFDEF